jgi:Na+/proline symporter
LTLRRDVAGLARSSAIVSRSFRLKAGDFSKVSPVVGCEPAYFINTGSMLKGAGKVISQATGGSVAVNDIVVAMTVMFVLYSFVGGLIAPAWTDLFQGVLIIVLSFMLIPLGWRGVGGLAGMKATLDPFRFTLATPSGIGPCMIAMLTVNSLVLVDLGRRVCD